MSEVDPQLLDRIRRHDLDALIEYLELLRPQLLGFINKSLSDALKRKVEPEDILQEASLSAMQALPQFDLTDRDPFGWVCQQIERRIIDAHRKYIGAQKRAATNEVGLSTGSDADSGGLIECLVASMTSPSQAFSRNQKEFKLLQALEQLPPDSREALRLRYVEGLPSKDIAERLGRSDGAVRVLLTRSLAKLQALLGDQSEFQTSK
jgi:RNA polymerase sigma-70 factor (ECF subfamily)